MAAAQPAARTRHPASRVGAAVAGLVAGAGLLVFTDAPWTHLLGVAGLVLCAVTVFSLSTSAPEQ